MTKKITLELPNENPDIGKEGPQQNPSIPPGVAGVWHAHRRQGPVPHKANVEVPGATYAMILPRHDGGVYLVIRHDVRDASGMATSMTSLYMTVAEAMKILEDNYTQTRFQG